MACLAVRPIQSFVLVFATASGVTELTVRQRLFGTLPPAPDSVQAAWTQNRLLACGVGDDGSVGSGPDKAGQHSDGAQQQRLSPGNPDSHALIPRRRADSTGFVAIQSVELAAVEAAGGGDSGSDTPTLPEGSRFVAILPTTGARNGGAVSARQNSAPVPAPSGTDPVSSGGGDFDDSEADLPGDAPLLESRRKGGRLGAVRRGLEEAEVTRSSSTAMGRRGPEVGSEAATDGWDAADASLSRAAADPLPCGLFSPFRESERLLPSERQAGRSLLARGQQGDITRRAVVSCSSFHPQLPVYTTGGVAGQVLLWRLGQPQGVCRYWQRLAGTGTAGSTGPHGRGRPNDRTKHAPDAGQSITSVRWSGDGQSLAATDAGGSVWLWHGFAPERAIAATRAHDVRATDVAFLNSGTVMAVTGESTAGSQGMLFDGTGGGGTGAAGGAGRQPSAASTGVAGFFSGMFGGGRGASAPADETKQDGAVPKEPLDTTASAAGPSPGSSGGPATATGWLTPGSVATKPAVLPPPPGFSQSVGPSLRVLDMRLPARKQAVVTASLHPGAGAECLAWDASRCSVISGGSAGDVSVLDLRTLSIAGRIPKAHSGPVRCIGLDPGARAVATGGQDGAVRLWELPSMRAVGGAPGVHPTKSFIGHKLSTGVMLTEGVTSVAFGEDALYSCGADGRVVSFER